MKSLDCEESKLEKLRRVQLPNYFKRLGVVIAVSSLLMLVINKFLLEQDTLSMILKHSLLVGLLFISLAKEKIEDERVVDLRLKSFMLAFFIGVMYALLLPIINYVVDLFIEGNSEFKPIGDFLILWQLLTMQIFSFEIFKRKSS